MSKRRRLTLILLLLLPLYVACSATYLGYTGRGGASDWHTASREPAGMAFGIDPRSLSLKLPLVGRLGPQGRNEPLIIDSD